MKVSYEKNELSQLLKDADDIVSADVENIKIDDFITEEFKLDKYEEKIVESALRFDNGQSNYSSVNFVANTGLVPYKKVQQCLMEVETRYCSFKEILRKLQRAKVSVKMLVRDMENLTDDLEIEMKRIDYDDLMYDITYWKRKLVHSKRELKVYIDTIKDIVGDSGNIEDYVKENPEEERKYWIARMTKQASMDIISYGRIGTGNMESILLMDERDQLETLNGSLKYAGLLNTAIGKINESLEGDFRQYLNLENLQMPRMALQTQLLEFNDKKEIKFSTDPETNEIII
jgi:hypothetical protein